MNILENKNKIILCLVVLCIVIILIYFFAIKEKDHDDLYENLENWQDKSIEKEEKVEEDVIIHITGEIKNPGIVKLKKGARVIDAVREAGGETNEADLSKINLALILEDGEKITIPNKNDESESQVQEKNGKININNANVEELKKLPGIGTSTSYNIVEYREKNGQFKKIEEIQNVKGIGTSKYEEIKKYITI